MAKRCNNIMVSGCRFILGNIEDEEVRTYLYDGPILTYLYDGPILTYL